MTVSRRRLSPSRLAAAIGVDTPELFVFGILPATPAALAVILGAWSAPVAALALATSIGTAGVVSGRRGYSAWQSAWFILSAVAAFLAWWIFTAILALGFLLH